MAPPHAILQDIVTKFAKEWLKQHLEGYVHYESRVQNLEGDVQNLEKVRDMVQHKVDEEETRYGREIDIDVQNWLERVKNIISKYKKFNEDDDREYAKCSIAFLPKWGIRRRLSINADGIMKQVTELREKAPSHDNFSHWQGPPSIDATLLNIDYESFESREKTTEDIMEALKDSSVRMLGVHGWSGVGKTTLVKEVARNAREDKLFNMVIMANVTRNPDIIKIQGQIAEMLGMELEEKSDIGRAARIRKRLKNDKENTLLILDDLWVKLDFNMLGIPFANDEDDGKSPETYSTTKTENLPNASGEKKAESVPDSYNRMGAGKVPSAYNRMGAGKVPSAYNESKTKETLGGYKGCKVLLISETKQVLMSQMEGKEKIIFSVDVLKETEAEMLFKKMAGIGYNNSEFKKFAAQIAKKCEGLPRSIVTTARALQNQRHLVWQDALRKLERQKLTDAPEFTTKLSYDLLENEELKYTFLLCARIGRDALIMDLVKYCIGLGVLEGVYSVSEARDRVHVLVGKLKESSLLYDSYSRDRFTMPDIVYRAALSIAAKENHAFTMTMGKLVEWPDKDKLKRYTAISLQHCDMTGEFPETINCPRLRVFHVENSYSHLKIPNNFFKGMKELRVLVLVGIHLSPLPSSIECLTELKMLCLERCILGEGLNIIGGMKKLRILSLSGSDIIQLPDELKQLTKLQIFDISNCSKLTKIPFGVISSLISLEELYMRNTPIQWKVEGQTNQSENASLSELRHLNQLTTLDIQIPDVSNLPNNLFFDKLYSYTIAIGDLKSYSETNFKMPEKYETSRFLAIHLKVGFDIHSQKGIKMLFERVENLLLEDLNGVQDIFSELNLKGFPYLKHLSIVSNSDIQSLIKSEDRQHPEMAFPKLESLYLYNLKNMEQICSCTLSAPSFGKLKVIKIKLCGQLKNVFLFSVVRLLTDLETIEVSECDTLKEIVSTDMQNTNENELLEFHQLRSLRLQSLSNFIGFYLSSSAGETGKLFHGKVVVPKLERMELSSIKINKIWKDQPSQSPNFRSLIHLDVNGCGNLTYLLSFSMAKRLVNLQSLFVSECEKMEGIFPQRQDDANMKDIIFPNLRNIKLSKMKILSEIWNSKAPLDSFGKLDTLIIEECHKLVHIFPRYMVGIFRSLCNIRVTNCNKMKVIFDLDDKKQDARDVTNLQDVHLEALPKLEYVWKWNKDQQGILNLENLQKILVHDCDSLESVFPVPVAEFLKNLEYLVLWDCCELREIFAMGEDTNTNTRTVPFEFPKLTTVKFSKLPNLESLYPGAHQVRCPVLSDFSVELCDKLEPFGKETANVQRRPIFPKEVISKFKSMQIESWHVNSSSSYNYRRDNLEELQLSRLMNTEILYSFLHRSPNLKSLSLNSCFFEELVPIGRPREIEKLGVVPKLKSLKLNDLPNLVMIGFERDPVLQRIEIVILKYCPSLLTVVPSSVSFSHLTTLEVVDCNGLINLMALSTAKSLVQLSTMKVIRCESMVEIVSGLRNEHENVGQIVFRQLEALELVSLKNLMSFCSPGSCVFEFPLLEKLVVSACPKMESFSEKIPSMPILQKIYAVHEKEKKRWYWEGNLKATMQNMLEKKKFFEGMDELSFSDYPVLLRQAWAGAEVGLQNGWFYSLETLKLENCAIQPYAIPSNILPYLKSLKELEVRDCNNLDGIFDMYEETSFKLKKLTLERLRNLTHVWKKNRQGILGFHNLQQLVVRRCNNLKTLFPEAIAKNLKKLEKLEIGHCDHLSQIVGKEEEAATAEATELFVFPRLTLLDLSWLPQLTYFYPERFILECPELNDLTVWYCGKLEVFPRHQEAHASSSISRQTLFSDLEAISNLEALMLDWKEIPVLWSRQSPKDLQYLNRLSLVLEKDVNEQSVLRLKVLAKAPNLNGIFIFNYNSLEIFRTHHEGGDGMLKHLKELGLFSVLDLQSIGSEDTSWLNTVYDNLKKLCVQSCPDLTILVTSAVYFSNLKVLQIVDCHKLEYLFPYSAAKKLTHLERMYIEQCKSMKEIVAKEQNETTSEEIKFERLEKIVLISLSSLTCFYSGNAILQLPSLIEVPIEECPEMNFFSQGPVHAESFRGIQGWRHSSQELYFHNDLNTTIKTRFFRHRGHLVLKDYHQLKDIWRGVAPIPDRSLTNLKSLEVEGCQFLSNAVLPSHILPFLRNLEWLKVHKCNSVEAIFDKPVHHTKIGSAPPLHLGLKTLILNELPNLKHVWNEDPPGIISLPFLEEVLVRNCESIKSLFPASVAKGMLKTLDVRSCEGLVEIVAKDEEGATEGAIEELIIFSSLASLTLWALPNLTCFYPGMHNQEWPMLTVLDVYECPMLKVFETDIQNRPDSHPEGQDCLPEEQQALVSADKVTPHLEELSLDKEDAMMIEQGQVHVDLQKLKFLKLQCFFDEFNVFQYVFLSKVPLPSIEKLGVVCSNLIEIFPSQRPDIDYTKILSQLKGLELNSLPRLNSIGFEHSWIVPLLQIIETLTVRGCHCLTNLVPSTVSFSVLTELMVDSCKGLKYLFTSSTAKSLGQLKKMLVKDCESLQEIMFGKAEESSSHDEGELIFEHLITLSLESLSSLRRFYNGSCALNYPSLEEMSVINCRRMLTFCASTITTDKLSKVKFEEQADAVPLEFDLNSTIGNASEALGKVNLVLGDYLELHDMWLGVVPVLERTFSNLNFLVVEGCQFLSNAVLPSHILPFLRNLEELVVQECNSVEAIFDTPVHHTKTGPGSSLHLRLKKLLLNELPNLKHVWNEDPQGIISLPFLEEVMVCNCESIKSLFPASVAKGMLKTLDVRRCERLVEIVAKDEEGAIEELIIFSSLATLILWMLPNLTCFYPGMHNQEWPMLTVLDVYECPMLKVFETDIQNCPDSHPDGQDCLPEEQQALVSADKVTPHLEELSLDKEDAMMIEQGQVHVDLQKLKFLKLQCFYDEFNVFQYVFLSKMPLPSIEKLGVVCSNLIEIFPSQRPDIDYTKILSQLKRLELNSLPRLNSIGFEHSWMAPFLQIIETLTVMVCGCLTNLVPSTVSFSVLTELIVDNCKGLKYLFTSSTAKSLGQLKKMLVKNCESLQEIMFDKAEESSSHDEGELIFEHLITLSLESLSSLRRFYNGSCALNYPSLEEMSVINCRRMLTFCASTITTKLSKVIFDEQADAVPLEFDLNSTIWNGSEVPITVYLVLGDYLELHDMWLGVAPIPDMSFRNLKSLMVEGCQFLSKAVLPSHILPFLRNLEWLKVDKCNSVEAIFDTPVHHTKIGPGSPLHLGLKKLILNELPNLKHVWNEDHQGIISLPFLEEVLVSNCESIKSLFPASVAKGMLKTLDVRRCERLVEIVAKDEEGAIEELIIFSSLATLILWMLPNLTCFYPGMHNQEWPMLTVLDVYECPMLKVFETDIQNCPDSHPEGQDCLPKEQQALVSADKVTPHLEGLSLNKEDVMMIERGQLHVDFPKLKFLNFWSFDNESDVFPYGFLSKVPLPSIEKLNVGASNFKEIFPSQRPDIDYTKILSQLKGLELIYLSRLNCIGFEHSWMTPFLQIIETLTVRECDCLTNLVPSTVSFSLLTELIVDNCHGLEYLFTSSTAKSLVALVKVEITNCKSLKKILENEPQEEEPSLKNNVEDEQEKDEPKDDEPEEDKIIFVKLKILSLSSLPRLECFYTGSSTLKFPSLVRVSYTQCDNMKMFCHGDVTVPKNLEGEIDGVPWSGVINTATNLS